ncbi:Ferric/cupric reductase transmembrane component 2 [Pleurostoma richardsiae]|uniref:Ferric/cupric reductase transmembrane component 2 n=1 Tax=Pleurostoma richardsiae TaxID=41990 RepID=A0AA38RUA0_9PEZI|nr:Ferric/cupric reductase transmembrane component 2 [Pleurostoma richardsiae]
MDITRTPDEWLLPPPACPPPRGYLRVLTVAASSTEGQIPDDPASRAYLQKLIDGITDGRTFVVYYNLILLALLLVFTVVHWREARHDRRKWRDRLPPPSSPVDEETKLLSPTSETEPLRRQTGESDDGTSSSSSSTIEGTATPPDAYKAAAEIEDLDVERLPLLGRRGPTRQPHRANAFSGRLRAWLAYQPLPIPFINRTLPSNATSLFVLSWLSLNAFFNVYSIPFDGRYSFLHADRAGLIFAANLPLLYLLAAKNQPLRLLTGRSYEALNIFHRRVGELLCLEAALHLGGMLVWRVAFEPEWLRHGKTMGEYLMHPLVLLGLGAFAAYELLFLTSLGSFRRRWYEVFLASHVILQALGLIFLWLHFFTARPYVGAALVIFLADRLVWRFNLKSASLRAGVSVLEDGETLLLSVEWDIPQHADRNALSPRHNILYGWRPTDHVFLTVPALGRTHSLQAHPFTIASAAPPIPSWALASSSRGDDRPDRARLDLLIRAQAGFTADLLAHARLKSTQLGKPQLNIRLDGPYGSPHALSLLRAADTAVLVAGGSGIAVVYPLAAALLLDDRRRQRGGRAPRAVKLLWVVRERAHRAWVPAGRLEALVTAGLELVVPEATAETGRRPDVAGTVEGWVGDGAVGGGEVGLVVSGPDGMNREVRNVCAGALGRGAGVRIAVEKFGW